jgi:hypothetical protein
MKPKQAHRIHVILRYFCISCVIVFGVISIIGTGGGGGDGGSVLNPITYTGLTTQAEITDANAEVLAAGAFGAGRTGSAFSGTGAVETGTDETTISFRTLKVTQALKGALQQVDLSFVSGGPIIGATQSENGSVSGPCGGTVSYSVQYDDATGVFSGTFTFNSYCDTGVVITGSATVSGTVDIALLTFESIRFDFTNLSDGSSTLSGYIDIDFTGVSNIRVDFDVLLKDNTTSKVYWVSNYIMYITIGSNYADVNISFGFYYDPDYGYVAVETPTPFRVYDTDIWPSSGVMIATGTGNTKAMLTAISNTQCQIDADLDGDDTYEWGPDTKNWEDL